MTILLHTQHGSHLYGLATPDSDLDTYTVVSDGRRAKQKIQGDLDTTVIPLSEFLRQCDMGVPQALEAMFSPIADPSPLDSYRAAYRINVDETRARYMRTIKNFVLDDRYPPEDYKSFKRRRHALRLVLNLNEALETGRFNPRLNPEQIEFVTGVLAAREAVLDAQENIKFVISYLAPTEINWES